MELLLHFRQIQTEQEEYLEALEKSGIVQDSFASGYESGKEDMLDEIIKELAKVQTI